MRKCKHFVVRKYGEPKPGSITARYDEKEEKYVITPKGCAYLAMFDAEIELKDEAQLELFWVKFQEHMQNAGYIEE
jgi:hypothetical protein